MLNKLRIDNLHSFIKVKNKYLQSSIQKRNQVLTLLMACLNFSSGFSSLNDLSKLFHSFAAKFVDVQRPQFLFEIALFTLSLDLVL